MWLIFAALSLLLYAVTDIIGKKSVNSGNSYTPLELCITVSILSFFISIILWFFGFGESGMSPWQLLVLQPLILVNLLCFFLYWIYYLLSFKFIRLSVAEAVSGSSGIFYFLGLILFNLCLGKLPAVREMFHPLRLIPIILVLTFIVLYPFAESFTKKNNNAEKSVFKKNRRSYFLGICILMLSLIIDSLDSLITTFIIDEGNISTVDYIMTSYFLSIFPAAVLFIFLCLKRKKWFIPLKNHPISSVGYSVSALLSSQLYMVASYCDAVRTGILFVIYPVVPIIGAKIFLKEKFTWRQNLCIWIITLSAIAFCVSDGLL